MCNPYVKGPWFGMFNIRCCLDINGKKVTFVLICPTEAFFSDMEGNTYWGSLIFQIKWWDEMNGKTSLMWPWSGGTGTMDYCAGLHLSWNYPVNQFGIDGTHATNVESKDKEDEMARELYCESWNHFRIKCLGVFVFVFGSTRLQMAFLCLDLFHCSPETVHLASDC